MKFTSFLFGFTLLTMSLFAQSEALQIMTFNIRFDNPDDGYDAWPHRQQMVKSMITYNEVDIVGLQEALRSQLDDMARLMPAYEWFGLCRTDGTTNPEPDNEFSAIFYRKEHLERLDGATFWLSETPEKPGSKSWDAAITRIVTWAKFRDRRSGQVFFLFNTHFDHVGKVAREQSAHLMMERIAAIAADAPVVLTGDFNCTETEAPYRVVTNANAQRRLYDAMLVSKTPHHGPLSTWSGFNFPGVPGRRIDFIFVNDRVQVWKHAILSDSWSGRFPSDHLPVLSRVVIANN
ncbi:MAG TPA: endonuclease/exonuclease/phosphatase family protein [Saprospiraceae bacterium]|nr:endonuclease/exonuclease/phosphatase family protein [Saprospiraceae bacterium]HMP14341.1 endonuclease/exonuclease/phosphatase family protein [Saprospiraceae bacterium]